MRKGGGDDAFRKIRRVLEFVWNSPYSSFYRDKYSKLGINLIKDINSIDDFKKLPFLTKEEIIKTDPYDRLYLPLDCLSKADISSGTTAGPGALSIVFKAGLSKVTRKIINEPNTKCLMHLSSLLRAIQRSSAIPKDKAISKRIKIAGDITNLPLSAKIAAKLRIDGLAISPTTLYFFTPYLKKEYNLDNIKFIRLEGEYCSIQKALFFKNNFKRANITCSYGLSENDGFVGLYCRFLNPLLTGYFHPNPESYYEGVDTTEGKELVLTSLLNNMFPLIRYKTGDAIETEELKCKCGQSKRFRILGRINYDILRIHGSFIYSHLVEKAMMPFNFYLGSSEWQLHVFENIVLDKIMPKLKLQVVLKSDYKSKTKSVKADLEQGISEKLYLSAKKTLADLVGECIFLPLEVEFVDSFPEKGKHRYIVTHLD